MTDLTTEELLMWQNLKEKLANVKEHIEFREKLYFIHVETAEPDEREKERKWFKEAIEKDGILIKLRIERDRLQKLFNAIDERI